MSILSVEKLKPRSWNFNSFLQMIALVALVWVGGTVTSTKDRLGEVNSKLKEQLGEIDKKLEVMKASNQSKWEQLDRIETEVGKQRDQLKDLQIQVERMKGK